MKKRITYLLGLVWLLSLSVDFFEPSTQERVIGEDVKVDFYQQAGSHLSYALIAQDSPKAPSFAVDWTLWSKLNTAYAPIKVGVLEAIPPSSFFRKSLALFDVKLTFIHFYYTW